MLSLQTFLIAKLIDALITRLSITFATTHLARAEQTAFGRREQLIQLHGHEFNAKNTNPKSNSL